MSRPGDLRALLMAGSGESMGFASLEKIENGILVHFSVAGRHRQKVPAHMLGGHPPTDPALGTPEKIIENWFVTKKTIFCGTLGEVYKAIEVAVTAKDEIERFEREGKFAGSQIESA